MKRNSKPGLTPIASAVALLVLGASMSAQAQQADQSKPQEVVVTGIRASLQQSINQKRNAESLVEVITAEDVGKMPDKNVADSLQRIPGVNVATAGGTEGGFGENDRVSLRGTPSALTLTTFNGHTVSSGDWYAANISGGGRSVSYSLFPSELIGRVTVHKSSQADLIEGGAAGSVDIESRKPLDFKQQLSAMGSVEGVRSSLSGKNNAQLSGLVNWKNDDNSMGIMVQAFDQKRSLLRDGQEFLWWDKMVPGYDGSGWVQAHPEVVGKNISLLTGTAQFSQERETKGGMMDLQYKVNPDLMFDLSGFYSKLEASNVNRNMMFAPYSAMTNGWSGKNGVAPSAWTIVGNTITSLTLPNTCPTGLDCSSMSTTVQDIAVRPGSYSDSRFVNLDVSYKANKDLSFTGKVGQTKGTGYTRDIGYEVWNAYSGGSISVYGLSQPAQIIVPGSNQLTFRPNNPIGGWASDVTATDKESYGQFDGLFKTGNDVLHSIKFGARFASHERNLTNLAGTVAPAGTLTSSAPNGVTTLNSSLPNVLNGTWTLTGDSVTAWANQYVTFNTHAYQSEFRVKEDVQAAYAMANFNAERVSGNFGVRVVSTKEHVENGSQNAVWAPIVTENTYTDFLPSANFRVDISDKVVGRFAVSRTMARPDFGQLAALSLLDTQMTGSGGNPNLKPIRSNNFDAGVEWYFAPKSMLSLGVFNMSMDSYVTYGSYVQSFYNYAQKANTDYKMSAALNTTAEVKGLELAYTQDFGNGFGVTANYTYADGKETGKAPGSACATTGDCSMVGTSKNSYNLGTYFENSKFNARIQYNYRSAFLNGLDRNSAIYQDAVGTVSASLGYNLTDNISLTLEGKDLNNPMLKSYATTPDQPRAFYKNGRQIYFGIRAKI
ncbi:TonB-dependent receptor [Undibacterium griseum]|uniref:TonB-dependent receptor n=1 Tax=Undibacterium griseum TaxID=2762295 RepID=A0ABR6YMJ5_9BURK|nr:TonB-dependent receptor [Undibacterium griseum]MBC3885123.1 TonB-dependent receptor [Undibacterium griseum]